MEVLVLSTLVDSFGDCVGSCVGGCGVDGRCGRSGIELDCLLRRWGERFACALALISGGLVYFLPCMME